MLNLYKYDVTGMFSFLGYILIFILRQFNIILRIIFSVLSQNKT